MISRELLYPKFYAPPPVYDILGVTFVQADLENTHTLKLLEGKELLILFNLLDETMFPLSSVMSKTSSKLPRTGSNPPQNYLNTFGSGSTPSLFLRNV